MNLLAFLIALNIKSYMRGSKQWSLALVDKVLEEKAVADLGLLVFE